MHPPGYAEKFIFIRLHPILHLVRSTRVDMAACPRAMRPDPL
jgi:hypothetical protein